MPQFSEEDRTDKRGLPRRRAVVATEAHIYFNPDSSPKLPADPEWSRSQALFEDAVGDGTYFADPNFEWEEEVEETKHGSGFPARRRARRRPRSDAPRAP